MTLFTTFFLRPSTKLCLPYQTSLCNRLTPHDVSGSYTKQRQYRSNLTKSLSSCLYYWWQKTMKYKFLTASTGMALRHWWIATTKTNKSYTLLCITALPTPSTVRFKYGVQRLSQLPKLCSLSDRRRKTYGAVGKDKEGGKPNYSGESSPSATCLPCNPHGPSTERTRTSIVPLTR